jgi:hypothetical protein
MYLIQAIDILLWVRVVSQDVHVIPGIECGIQKQWDSFETWSFLGIQSFLGNESDFFFGGVREFFHLVLEVRWKTIFESVTSL